MAAPDFPLARTYVRPDLATVETQSRAYAASLAAARGEAELLSEVERWNALRVHVDTMRQLAMVRYHQDTRDAGAKTEEDFWNDASGLLRELDALHARTLLASPHRAAIDRSFGVQFLKLKECAAATFAPEIRDSIAEEARLCTRYTELLARPEVQFRGEKYTMMGIARFFVDADRTTRLEAQRARDAFLGRIGEALDEIYDKLVALRDRMGRALGHRSFVPLGYQLMNRTGYGPSEVAAFREEILREVVPLATDLHRGQSRRLGLDRVLYHDEPVGDPKGNPRPLGGVEFCVDAAARMYDELGAEFGAFFRSMVDERLLDLADRPGKAGGGFCTHFAETGAPFVFASFNGTDGDVRVLTHECGHAFQAWSSRSQPLLEYRFPTYEACEIHSMSMEYLTYPWMDRFFGEAEGERYRRMHLEQEIVVLPYMALVDHFQHEVYENPSMSPAERKATWHRLESMYLPHRDYGGELPYLASGGLWQRQLHVYVSPFYYIDYALAGTCALQMWKKSTDDRARALKDYLAVCRPGGSLPFEGLVSVAGLRLPFERGCLGEVVAMARRALA